MEMILEKFNSIDQMKRKQANKPKKREEKSEIEEITKRSCLYSLTFILLLLGWNGIAWLHAHQVDDGIDVTDRKESDNTVSFFWCFRR